MMELKGTLHKKFDVQRITDTFSKREFVLRTADNPSYPQYVKLELWKDKSILLDNAEEGDELMVRFDIKGKEYTNKNGDISYFNSLVAFKIDKLIGTDDYDGEHETIKINAQDMNNFDDEDVPF